MTRKGLRASTDNRESRFLCVPLSQAAMPNAAWRSVGPCQGAVLAQCQPSRCTPSSRMLPSVIAGPGGCLGFGMVALRGARFACTQRAQPIRRPGF